MQYVATFKENTKYAGYSIFIKAKNMEKAKDYMENIYQGEYEEIYPIRVYQRYQDEYNSIGMFNEVKLKEITIK